ncbi:MAG: methylmalonyl-CoA mutase family protein [Myxococcota bacterium]|nr:methylmalonyl-CoA mutase family protein [Myxococcota bacterium]
MTKNDDRITWENGVLTKAKERFPERQPVFKGADGDERPRLLDPTDRGVSDPRYRDHVGYPGQYPFTRGAQPTMYRARHWTMRQYAGFGTAAESNERYHYLLSQGQTGLSVAFDLPTQMGYDSNHSMAAGEVGKVGVAIDTIEDMELLLKDLPLDQVSTSMTINATASTLLALYVATATRRGISLDRLAGTVQNDILKEYIARGTYIYPPGPSMRVITDMFAWCADHVPRWNTISISGYHIREAGSTAAQELGFTLADGIAYVQAALDAGLDVDQFAGRLSFFFNVHNDLLEEVAKFRAARRLWAQLMKERFGAKIARSMTMRIHAQVAGSTLTAQQPDNNVARVTLQALAAVLGGTNSLHTNARDEALALPTETSARIALRTQQIIAFESGVADTVDPLAGSYYVEELTDRVEAGARRYSETIDDLGGMVRAIEQGYPQREIQDAAYQAQRAVETGAAVVVGVNRFTAEDDSEPELLRVDPSIEREQVARLDDFMNRRDGQGAQQALLRLKNAAEGSENLMPYILDSVENEASLGEIADSLRDVFGLYRERVVI